MPSLNFCLFALAAGVDLLFCQWPHLTPMIFISSREWVPGIGIRP